MITKFVNTWVIKIANNAKLLVYTALAMLGISSAFYMFLEHHNVSDSIWWSLVTATTVGYGDTYPKTTPGRAIAITLILAMVFFFIPMVTASFAAKLIVNRDAFTHEEQEELKTLLRTAVTQMEQMHGVIDSDGDGKLG